MPQTNRRKQRPLLLKSRQPSQQMGLSPGAHTPHCCPRARSPKRGLRPHSQAAARAQPEGDSKAGGTCQVTGEKSASEVPEPTHPTVAPTVKPTQPRRAQVTQEVLRGQRPPQNRKTERGQFCWGSAHPPAPGCHPHTPCPCAQNRGVARPPLGYLPFYLSCLYSHKHWGLCSKGLTLSSPQFGPRPWLLGGHLWAPGRAFLMRVCLPRVLGHPGSLC